MSFRRDAKECFDEKFLAHYQSSTSFFFGEIERLHVTRFMLDRIVNYPVPDILNYDTELFWKLFVENYTDICLLIISRLLDSDEKAFSLRKFKNEILRNINSVDIRKEFKKYQELQLVNFSDPIVEEKIKNIRHSVIAHVDSKWYHGDKRVEKISWLELDKLIDYLKQYFASLLFNSSFLAPNSAEYHTEITVTNSKGPDIDFVLGAIENRSTFIGRIAEFPSILELDKNSYTTQQQSFIAERVQRRGI